MVRLGFDREHLVSSIRTRQQNKATVTYWLLLDNRRRMPSSGYLSAELSEAAAAAAHQAAMAGHQQQPQQQQLGYIGQGGSGHPSYPGGSKAQHGGLGHHHSGAMSEGHGLPQQRLVAERKWRLGWHARGHPSALMAELYRVLQVGRGELHTQASAIRVSRSVGWSRCRCHSAWMPGCTWCATPTATTSLRLYSPLFLACQGRCRDSNSILGVYAAHASLLNGLLWCGCGYWCR